jgi:hypothetical protein
VDKDRVECMVDMVDRICVVSGYLVTLDSIFGICSVQSCPCLCKWANGDLTCVFGCRRSLRL